MKKLNFGSNKMFNKNKKAGYNGWSNYPTWYMNTYLIEDEDQDRLKKFVKDVLGDEEHDYPEGVLAEALEDRAKDIIYNIDNAPSDGLAGSLLDYAFGQVEFYELGYHLYKLSQERGWLTENDEEDED